MTTRRIVLRSIACSMGLGFGWGTVAAAVSVADLDDSWGILEMLGILPLLALFGGGIGAVVGFVLGMPTVFMIYPLRDDLPHCRRVGAAGAAALPAIGTIGLAVAGGGAADGAMVLGIVTVAVAVSAWTGLGWIFRPAERVAVRPPA